MFGTRANLGSQFRTERVVSWLKLSFEMYGGFEMSTSHFKDDFWSTVRLEKMSNFSKEISGEAFILPVLMFPRRFLLARETAVLEISHPRA